MKEWLIELLIGIALTISGVLGIFYWLGEVILVLKGAIGPLLLIIGLLLLWIGYEDKKLEKELAEIEKEIKEETEEAKENK
ncbi:MAG: hypothetical protein QW038_02250 [Nanopusillaceae archaeon]